jgi:hypothetical protein
MPGAAPFEKYLTRVVFERLAADKKYGPRAADYAALRAVQSA